VTSFPRRPL
jgi:hypothetical protein